MKVKCPHYEESDDCEVVKYCVLTKICGWTCNGGGGAIEVEMSTSDLITELKNRRNTCIKCSMLDTLFCKDCVSNPWLNLKDNFKEITK